MEHTTTNLRTRLGALRGLMNISDEDFNAYMDTYGELFADSPENTKADYENGVPMQGYRQGSSKELETLYRIIHLLCTLGSVEKMYMPPVLDPEKSVIENQILLEEKMAKDLGVQEVRTNDKIAKVSVVGVGMRSHAGIAAKMFSALGISSSYLRAKKTFIFARTSSLS